MVYNLGRKTTYDSFIWASPRYILKLQKGCKRGGQVMEFTTRQKILRGKERAIRKIREKKEAFIDYKKNKVERSFDFYMPQHIDDTSMRRKDI